MSFRAELWSCSAEARDRAKALHRLQSLPRARQAEPSWQKSHCGITIGALAALSRRVHAGPVASAND